MAEGIGHESMTEETEGGTPIEAAPDATPRAPSRDMEMSFLHTVWDWTKSIAVAFVLFLVIRSFVVEAFKIPTSSMENTLLVGDFLIVNKAVYGAELPGTGIRIPAFAEPDRGDVIVFNPPHDPSKNYVKRLIGLPGDTLEMQGKHVFVNGILQEEPYARYLDRGGDAVHPSMGWQHSFLPKNLSAREYSPSRDNWGPLVVPADQFFVLGDNRDNSEDSRYWGFVDREAIRGRPWFIYYSFRPADNDQLSWIREVRWGRIGGRIE